MPPQWPLHTPLAFPTLLAYIEIVTRKPNMAATLSFETEQPTQTSAPERKHWALFVFFLLAALLYVLASFTPVLFDETEGQYAGAAREMLQGHHLLTPTNDGMPRLQGRPSLGRACQTPWLPSPGFGLSISSGGGSAVPGAAWLQRGSSGA